MRKFALIIAMLVAFIPAHAVLKEQDLEKTLGILRQELTNTHDDNEKSSEVMKKRNQEILERVFNTFRQSNQNALMLYSQKDGYVFDQAYACHEATEQFQKFKSNTLPFRNYMNYFTTEIARYDSLINSLKNMRTSQLSEQAKIDRNVCMTYAVNLRNGLMDDKREMQEYLDIYNRTENRLKTLNDYASKRYNEIQNDIFRNGGDNYFSILGKLKAYFSFTVESVKDKYRPSGPFKSQWSSPSTAWEPSCSTP